MSDNIISHKNRIFQKLPEKYRISFAKAKVAVEKRLDESIHIKYKDQHLNFKEITSYETKRNKTNTLPPENLRTGDIFTLYLQAKKLGRVLNQIGNLLPYQIRIIPKGAREVIIA